MLVVAGAARADNGFVVKTQVYTDNDHTTVVSPLVAISRDAWRGSTLSASWVADVISSASVDVVSNATPRISEFRNEITAGIKQQLRDTTLSGLLHLQHRARLPLAQPLARHRAGSVSAQHHAGARLVALARRHHGRTGDSAFHRSLMVEQPRRELDPGPVARHHPAKASYSFNFYDNGYQASPYRFVRLEAADGSTAFKLPETDPSTRNRHAFDGGAEPAPGRGHGAFRATTASTSTRGGWWQNTVQLRYTVTLGDFTVRIRERFYYQSGAGFYRACTIRRIRFRGSSPPIASCRRSGRSWRESSCRGTCRGGSGGCRPRPRSTASISATATFPLLNHRYGADIGLGLSVNY